VEHSLAPPATLLAPPPSSSTPPLDEFIAIKEQEKSSMVIAHLYGQQMRAKSFYFAIGSLTSPHFSFPLSIEYILLRHGTHGTVYTD